ncbi:hypothetical protein ETH_00023955 [Eimeria tenella]|uniref:Uncharacterized protein n=1 Tax=Eimeria tenella TaxID=5802 RepID=U6KXV1_EIMTE|nr:hypothetical protein ETH_00023955 [Eimeria tenella]CDJ41159.1 hypothetical protein ETH_00023955 [Eimeria tenella]|eukprot:XP_013231909.1 hypothetical protein ETH_00023955 [Eimeria tenella]
MNTKSVRSKRAVLTFILLGLFSFPVGQAYPRQNPYNFRASVPQSRVYSTAAPMPAWNARRWNSVHELSQAMRAHDSPRHVTAYPPSQNTHPQLTISQTAATTRRAPHETILTTHESSSMAPRYPGVSSGTPPQLTQASYAQVVPEGRGVASSYAPAVGTTQHSSSAASRNYTAAASTLVKPAARRSNNMGFRPPPQLFRDPRGATYTQAGRTTSSFMGIASTDSYSPYSPGRPSGGTPGTPEGSDGAQTAETTSAETTTVEEEESEPTEEDESTEVQSSGRMGERRTMNPYDLSHIFPDIYQEEQPPSHENMAHQSLELLEMTALNSSDEE